MVFSESLYHAEEELLQGKLCFRSKKNHPKPPTSTHFDSTALRGDDIDFSFLDLPEELRATFGTHSSRLARLFYPIAFVVSAERVSLETGFIGGQNSTGSSSSDREDLNRQIRTIGFSSNSCLTWNELLAVPQVTRSRELENIPFQNQYTTEEQRNPWQSVPQIYRRNQETLRAISWIARELSLSLRNRHTGQNSYKGVAAGGPQL